MFRITPFQFLFDFSVGPIPKSFEVLRHLNRPPRRRKQVQHHGHATERDARRIGKSEHLLQFDGKYGRLAGFIVESNFRSARHGDMCWRALLQPPLLSPVEP